MTVDYILPCFGGGFTSFFFTIVVLLVSPLNLSIDNDE
jgi:hypothetical protein